MSKASSPPDFASAGPHWNPTGQKHGKDNPQGMHKGDLPNLIVGPDGRGSFEYTIPHAILSGMLPTKLVDQDGAAGHSGAVPRWLRQDAVFALAELLMRLDENWQALNARGDLFISEFTTFGRVHRFNKK